MLGRNRLKEAIHPFGGLDAVGDGFARVSIAISLRRYRLALKTEASHTPFPNIEASVHELHVPAVIKDLANLLLVVVVKVPEIHSLLLQRCLDRLNFQHMVCMLSAPNFSPFIDFHRLPGWASSWRALDLPDVCS